MNKGNGVKGGDTGEEGGVLAQSVGTPKRGEDTPFYVPHTEGHVLEGGL